MVVTGQRTTKNSKIKVSISAVSSGVSLVFAENRPAPRLDKIQIKQNDPRQVLKVVMFIGPMRIVAITGAI